MFSVLQICIYTLLICTFKNCCSVKSLSTENLRHKPATDKLTLAEWPSYNIQNPNGPGTYAYGYEIDDPASKNVQFRDEEKLANGTVQGTYGIVRTNGMVTLTRYISDAGGYRAKTQTFNQGDVTPNILTTEAPKISPMPSGIGYLDLNLETASKDVTQETIDPNTMPGEIAQQILTNPSKIGSSSIVGVTIPTLLDRIDNGDDDSGDDENEDPDAITNELQNLQGILSGQSPIIITTTKDDKNQTVGVQFVNNYIPHNFQLVPFFLPKRYQQSTSNDTPLGVFHDQVDNDEDDIKPFVNDKFHDPLDDYREEIPQKTNPKNIGKRRTLMQRRNKVRNMPQRQDAKLKKLKTYKVNNKKQRRNNNNYRIILV